MNRLAPWLLILLAMGLCAWSLAAAQESPGDQSQASPTPLEMPTPVPVPGEEEVTPTAETPTPSAEATPVPEATPEPEAMPAPEATPLPVQTRLEGQIAFQSAFDTHWDPEQHDVWSNDLYAYLGAAANWGMTYSAVAAGLFEYRWGIGEQAHGEAIPEIRKLYGLAHFGPLDLYVGWQIVSWGVVDAVSPMDILNPTDYRRVIDAELDYSRLATLMVRPVVYAGPVTIDAVYIPFFTPSRYDIVGSDWALLGGHFPLNDMVIRLRTDPHWNQFERIVDHYVPEWRNSLQRLLNDPKFFQNATDIPNQNLTAPEGAVRVSWRTPYLVAHAAYYAMWDDLPTMHVNPAFRDLYKFSERTDQGFLQLPPLNSLPLEELSDPFRLTHHRVQSVGLGLSGVVHDIGLRGEGRMDFDRYTYRTDLTAVRRNDATWVLNADYTFRGNFLVEGLLLQGYLFDREHDFISRAWQNAVGLIIRRPFFDERVLLEFLGLLDFTYMRDRDWRRFNLTASGWLVTPLVTYVVTDRLRASVGANFFGGGDSTLLGQLERNDRVFALLRYGF